MHEEVSAIYGMFVGTGVSSLAPTIIIPRDGTWHGLAPVQFVPCSIEINLEKIRLRYDSGLHSISQFVMTGIITAPVLVVSVIVAPLVSNSIRYIRKKKDLRILEEKNFDKIVEKFDERGRAVRHVVQKMSEVFFELGEEIRKMRIRNQGKTGTSLLTQCHFKNGRGWTPQAKKAYRDRLQGIQEELVYAQNIIQEHNQILESILTNHFIF